MSVRYFQKGFNYSQDGPGNRLVYHLHGCNLCCPWCSNPEGMRADTVYSHYPVFEATVEELESEILSCTPMFFDGGGVTFTGGEATLQLSEVTSLFKRLKKDGIDTCIETNALHKDLPSLFPFLDHLIMDVKSGNAQKFKDVTGGSLEPIICNLQAAADTLSDITVHIPLIHGFNDGDEDTALLLKLLLPFKNKIKIEFLSYHEYGKEKWEKCGLTYKMKDAFISDTAYRQITEKFKLAGFNTVRT